MRACRSRVTHPSAGRRQPVLLPVALPLDLHVLSLPLAFILSQDQTLLCIVLSGIDALEFLVFRYLLYCFSSLVNDLFMSIREPLSPLSHPHFPNGIAKVHLFSFPPNFFTTFLHIFFCTRRHRNPQTPVNHRIPQKKFFSTKKDDVSSLFALNRD